MAKSYSPEAVETARKLYCENGGNPQRIQEGMRKAGYANWNKQLLLDKGTSGPNARLGWITKFGFEKSLQLHLETKIGAVQNDDERRYKAVVQLADKYQGLALQGDDKAVGLFIKLTDQQIELRNKLDLQHSTLETFVEAFERMTVWAKDIDQDLAKLFFKRKDEFIERALVHYGEQEETDIS
jgi:hypothetical protein